MSQLRAIYRYPVKGLSGNLLNETNLQAGKPVHCDRSYALALADTAFDPGNPVHLGKRHFLMLMRDEKLAELSTAFFDDGHRLVISKQGEKLLDVSLQNENDREALGAFFEGFLGEKVKGRPRLVSAEGHMFADVPEQNLSVINLDTVRDIEAKTGLTIDANRFRGNLLVEGIGAWKEFDLVGQDFTIGDVRFHGAARIDRCAAVNVNLETTERDMNIPLQIRKAFGHVACGVYVDVTAGGTIRVGDAIKLP